MGNNKELYSSFLPVIRNIERELKRKLFSHCRILLFRVTTKAIYFTNINENRYCLIYTYFFLVNFYFDTLKLQNICKSICGNSEYLLPRFTICIFPICFISPFQSSQFYYNPIYTFLKIIMLCNIIQ